jgi:hypothetical protein
MLASASNFVFAWECCGDLTAEGDEVDCFQPQERYFFVSPSAQEE